MSARIRLGMVGGGIGGFFGTAHRLAARIDDQFELVAAALSSDPRRALESGQALGLPSERCYADFSEMARIEAERPDGVQAVGIVTPNHLHHRAALAFLNAGIHVMCDKPLTTRIEDALELQNAVRQTGLAFGVSYTNAGFGMVREARRLVAEGAIGRLRVVQVEFPQQWLATAFEAAGNKQAAWRTDPALSGPAGSLGDIGTHAFHLVEYVSGRRVEAVAGQASTFVPGRRVDDNVHVMLRLEGGATGALWVSQVAVGYTNGCRIRAFGDEGSLEWAVTAPNELKVARLNEAYRVLERASSGTSIVGRMPPGHPEGFLEALGQLYADFAAVIRDHQRGASGSGAALDLLPGIEDGVRGVRFVEAVLQSSHANSVWVPIAG